MDFLSAVLFLTGAAAAFLIMPEAKWLLDVSSLSIRTSPPAGVDEKEWIEVTGANPLPCLRFAGVGAASGHVERNDSSMAVHLCPLQKVVLLAFGATTWIHEGARQDGCPGRVNCGAPSSRLARCL